MTLNLKELISKLVNTPMVIEEGTTDGWTWRKWSNGKIEAWNVYSFLAATPSVWVSPIRYMDKTINIPNGIFTAAPNMIATSPNNQYWIVDCVATTATAGSMRIATLASSSMASAANIYAWTD